MPEKKYRRPRKKVDHSRTNRNAIITAIILTFIIISAASAGLILIQSQAVITTAPNKAMMTTAAGSDKSKSKFLLKIYDYIARSQMEIHSELNNI